MKPESRLRKVEGSLRRKRIKFTLKEKILGGIIGTVIALGGIELLAFHYHPRSQKAIYNGDLKKAWVCLYAENKTHDLKGNLIGEGLGAYQAVKLDILRGLLR